MGAAFLEFPGNEFRPLLHLSEGQKIVLNLILNIAFKICVLNPHLENPLDFTEGIVLIDELDLHLHPAWQRNIVHALKDVFPKIQFFATSHSPQIIGELKPEEIIVLDNTVQGGWWRPPASFGMNSADILKTIMDAPERNSKISTNIGEAFRLINAKQYQEAEIIVANLRKEMGSASDVVQLEAYLSRYLNTATQGVAA
jgi:predicted ATP-binding protein involved in virulence